MRNFLFLDTETTGLNTGKDRIVRLSTRLVLPAGFKDYNQLVRPENFAIPVAATRIHGITNQVAALRGAAISRVLDDLSGQIERAEIIVGHNVEYDIAIISAEAKRNGYHDLVGTLTHPKFGLDAGRRAAICTQRLAADFLRFLGESHALSDTKLPVVYRRFFREELSGAHNAMVNVIACQRVYNYLRRLQLKHGLDFPSDIVCLED
jgi:DNA polymerase III epsilon subunit-like protein